MSKNAWEESQLKKLRESESYKISEIGTCQACGRKNSHLVFQCLKCGRKICLEECEEMMGKDGLCIHCMPKIVPYEDKK